MHARSCGKGVESRVPGRGRASRRCRRGVARSATGARGSRRSRTRKRRAPGMGGPKADGTRHRSDLVLGDLPGSRPTGPHSDPASQRASATRRPRSSNAVPTAMAADDLRPDPAGGGADLGAAACRFRRTGCPAGRRRRLERLRRARGWVHPRGARPRAPPGRTSGVRSANRDRGSCRGGDARRLRAHSSVFAEKFTE